MIKTFIAVAFSLLVPISVFAYTSNAEMRETCNADEFRNTTKSLDEKKWIIESRNFCIENLKGSWGSDRAVLFCLQDFVKNYNDYNGARSYNDYKSCLDNIKNKFYSEKDIKICSSTSSVSERDSCLKDLGEDKIPAQKKSSQEKTGHSFCEPNTQETECLTADGRVYVLSKRINQLSRTLTKPRANDEVRAAHSANEGKSK